MLGRERRHAHDDAGAAQFRDARALEESVDKSRRDVEVDRRPLGERSKDDHVARGALATISSAPNPTSTTLPVLVSIATMVGSLKTMPRCEVARRVLEVPISSATSKAMDNEVNPTHGTTPVVTSLYWVESGD